MSMKIWRCRKKRDVKQSGQGRAAGTWNMAQLTRRAVQQMGESETWTDMGIDIHTGLIRASSEACNDGQRAKGAAESKASEFLRVSLALWVVQMPERDWI